MPPVTPFFDPEVSEATLIENVPWALAEIEGPAEQLKLLRELFEKLQSALTSVVGFPFVNLILTPIIRRLKEAIVDLQEYFRGFIGVIHCFTSS